MANIETPFRFAGSHKAHVWQALADGKVQWPHAPRMRWECIIDTENIWGAGTTRTTVVTIPAAGLVSGRVTLTFSGFGLSADVAVVADAAVGDDENALATTLEAAVATARAGDLVGVLSNETVTTNAVTMTFIEGIAEGTVVVTWRSAQQFTVELAGTIYDAIYRLTFSGGGLGSPVVVDTARTAGTPAAITDMIVQRETDVEGDAGLTGVLVSALDDGATLNTLVFEPDVADVTITPTIVLDTEAMTQTVVETTAAGPTITQATTLVIDLNEIAWGGGFPSNVTRSWCMVNVVTGFGASRTITVGDAGDPDGLLGSTPIDLNTAGRSGSIAADGEYQPRPELAFVPTATIDLDATDVVTVGEVIIGVLFYPNLVNEAYR